MTIKLGDTARDTLTGLTGAVVARHEYLNGCVRLSLQPNKLKDGKPVDWSVFDIEQIELVKAAKPRRVLPSGGPHDEPVRPSAPSR